MEACVDRRFANTMNRADVIEHLANIGGPRRGIRAALRAERYPRDEPIFDADRKRSVLQSFERVQK